MTQKEKTFLDQTAQRLHLTVDGESSILFGSVGGYQTMLRRNDQGLCRYDPVPAQAGAGAGSSLPSASL